MKYINNKKDWSNLISILTENRNHFSSASDGIKSGIDTFCEMLETEYIVHASANNSGMVWQSRPLISCFCETFDPILSGIFSENSQTRNLLDKHQRLLPLASTLTKKENCRNVADKIKNAILNLEDMLPIEASNANKHAHPNNWDEIIEAAESLELVAGCLYAIYGELISQDSRWCVICFRKSSSNSIYCDSHKASKSNALQDTQHRKGLRIRERIPADIHKKWILHRSKRSSLGDDFLLFALTADVPDQIFSDTSGVIVEKPMKDFVEATQSQNWSQVCDYWNVVLKRLPTVNNILIKQANEFNSWNAFRSAILFSLKNKHETTQHPYWIFMMLIEAEDWLSIEKQFSDMRLTDTEDKTITLALLGKSNTEIANELNISRTYVWRIKKLNDIP